MKFRVMMLYLTCLMAAVIVACQPGSTTNNAEARRETGTATPAASVDRKAVVDQIHDLLARHDKALSDKNMDALMATFSADPSTVVMGTGSEEKWQGPQEIRAAYTEMFKDYDPGTLQANCDWKTGGADEGGTMAWLAAICNAKDSLAGKTREYKLNVSSAVEKQGGNWKFVSLHMSNAFQPPVTK